MEEHHQKMVIYQMITRLFGNKKQTNKPYGTIEENGVGKMADITDVALKAIKKMGISHVWYTGIIEHAQLSDYTEFGIPLDDADVVKGRAGSPYAIKDYYDVDPDIAVNVTRRIDEFKELIDRTHNNELDVIIDFVPNHVARAYQSDSKPEKEKDLGEDDDLSVGFSSQNNFYYLPDQSFQVPVDYLPLGEHSFPTKDGYFNEQPAKATGNDQFTGSPSKDDWFETVKLNYGVDYLDNHTAHFDPIPDTWERMLSILIYWTRMGVDGFRCDMVHMVPIPFWKWVIPQVKKVNPRIVFIAEIYEPHLYRDYLVEGKFDFLYDKVELYDTLRNILANQDSTDSLPNIWKSQEGISHRMLRFLENHDEQRIASSFFAGEAERAIPAMVVAATMHTSPVLIYFGQEVGETGEGMAGFSSEDGRTTLFDYWGLPQHQRWMNNGKFDGAKLNDRQNALRKFYSDILNFSRNSEAISAGHFYDLHFYNRSEQFQGYSDRVFAFLRYTPEEKLLIVTNFHSSEEKCQIKIPDDAFDKMEISQPVDFRPNFNNLSETNESVNQSDGLSIVLPAYSFEIFTIG